MKAPCQFVSHAKISPHSSVCFSLPLCLALPRCFQRDLRHLAAAERASKNNNSPLFLLLKPVLCHCLPFLPSSISPLSSLGSLSVSLYHPPPFPSSPLTTAQDESASMCPCSSSLSGAPRWSSSSLSNWAPTAGWNYSSPPKLSPLFLNKCGCSNRGVLLIHLYRAVWGARGACRTRRRGSNKPRSQCTTQSA